MNGAVKALAQHGGQLVAGGAFTTAGGNSANHVAQWDGSNWSAMGGGLGNLAMHEVRVLTEYIGELYAGGTFIEDIGAGNTAYRVARWGGSDWIAMYTTNTGVGGGTDTSVNAMTAFDHPSFPQELLVLGGFFSCGGRLTSSSSCDPLQPHVNVSSIAAFTWPSGGSPFWNDLGVPGNGMLGSVESVVVYNSTLYVGGGFTQVGTNNWRYLVQYDGTSWSTVGGTQINGSVHAMTVFNGELYVGGTFTQAPNGTPASAIARWNGSTWSAVGGGIFGVVLTLAVHDDGTGPALYAGGQFLSPGNRIARWDGTSWTSLGSGINVGVEVKAFASYGGDLFVGGTFSQAGGQMANNIARWSCIPSQDIACCQLTGACSLTDPVTCQNNGGTPLPGVTSCNPNPCLGACCLPSGCQDGMTALGCPASNGNFQGYSSTCATHHCCGNGVLDPSEQCDPPFDTACPGQCLQAGLPGECTCGGSVQCMVTSLHPTGAVSSRARAVDQGMIVGEAVIGTTWHAGMWTGMPPSWTDLHPPGATSSAAYGVDGSQGVQVGNASIGGVGRATWWSGSAGSAVDLHPSGASQSHAYDVDGGQIVGAGVFGGAFHAILWNGTTSWVDLHPSGAIHSEAIAVEPGEQTGYASFGDGVHAGLWNSSAGSWMSLRPAGTAWSKAYGIGGGQQVGEVLMGANRASLWRGSVASWINLHPPGAVSSIAFDIDNQHAVGEVNSRAALWTGSTLSPVDLQQFVGPNFTWTTARGIEDSGASVMVVGFGYDAVLDRQEALMWECTIPFAGSPAPATACSGGSRAGRDCLTGADCPGGSCSDTTLQKNRYISIQPTNAAGGMNSSIRVEVLGNPLDPGTIGQVWWADAEGSIANPPHADLRGAALVCSPTPGNAQVWTTGNLHLYGTAIVPGATYGVSMCDSSGGGCSTALTVGTAKWGDVVAPFGSGGQPNFADVNAVVAKFQLNATSQDTRSTDLRGSGNFGVPNLPDQGTNFGDVSADVAAFQGTPYPFTTGTCP